MTTPPVWLLDIDGVINANKPGWGAAPRRIRCAGFTIRWAPALTVRIRQLHCSGAADVRWSSTWCGYPTQLDELASQLGLHFERAFTGRPDPKTWADMKADAAMAVLAEGRRLIWTDDDEAEIAAAFYPEVADAQHDGRALLISPRPNRGLQPDHLDRIAAFIGLADSQPGGEK